MQVSQQLLQSQPCSQAALLTDAQAQAKQAATGAGVSAGAILSMGEGSSGAALQVGPGYQLVADYPLNTGITSVLGGTVAYSNTLLTPPPLTCSLTVQFQLM